MHTLSQQRATHSLFDLTLKKLNRREVGLALTSLSTIAILYLRWRSLDFTFHQPPIWVIAVPVVVAIAWLRRLPLTMSLWWLAGSVTIAWSLAPGNTLVASLWELLFLAAFIAGTWRPGFWILAIALLLTGVADSLSLNMFGLEMYISGSIHYVAGAQALTIVPISLWYLLRPGSYSVLVRLSMGILVILSTYMALASGARAVYLPFLISIAAFVIRFMVTVRAAKWLAPLTLVALALVLSLVDSFVTNQPIGTALGVKGSVSAQVEATGDSGVFTQRLRFWEQTVDMAVANPLGTGNGSYAAVSHAYQKYPMLWARSPHNYFLETAATGGWLRLALLLALLVFPLWRVWNSNEWAWSLAAAGLWATLAFDVTSYYSSVMGFAFLTLGAATSLSWTKRSDGNAVRERVRITLPSAIRAVFAVAAMGVFLWWYVPCNEETCATSRYLGIDYKVMPTLAQSSPATRSEIFVELKRLYPQSLWVLQAASKYADNGSDMLEIRREIALRFPDQHPDNYLDWAHAALAVGDQAEAKTALRTGLEYFPRGKYPYGEMRMTPDRYETWLLTAEELLDSLVD